MAYDLVQSVYMMNAAANGVSSYVNTQPKLQTYLRNYLNGGLDPMGGTYQGFFPFMNAGHHPDCESLIGGDWSVAWGPGVCLQPTMASGQAANAMYVAHSRSQNTFVVAIAATNPASVYDWMAEDADVAAKFMAKWPPELPFVREENKPPAGKSGAAISAATALGLSNLLTADGMSDPTTKQTLQQFLGTIKKNSLWNDQARIIFSGHSLAGALSPTLALYLHDTGGNVLSSFHEVLVLPTAGATPGNKEFADLWKKIFPQKATKSKSRIENWNTDIGSEKDIVPHAWNKLKGWVTAKNLDLFNSKWGPIAFGLGASLFAAEEAAIKRGNAGGYQNLSQELLDPEHTFYQWKFDFNKNVWQYPPTLMNFREFTEDKPIRSAADLGDIIVATHVHQYYRLFDVAPWPRMTLSVPAQSKDATHNLDKQF